MAVAASAVEKRCLYEVLDVSRECSSDDIRSAYRRQALRLHPDKQAASGVSPETATAAFQELLHAYEVLSDPKERAWYDSHRSQILFSTSSSKSSSPFADLDIYSFMSPSAFSGYSDTGRGFYKVYGDVFAKLYSRELFFAQKLGLRPDSVSPAPLIGNLESPCSQIISFYNYWQSFFTVLDFSWVDTYDSFSGEDRKSRRAMEEANKKLRKKAKREYNDNVWSLAAFVKKRDSRVKAMLLKKRMEKEKMSEELAKKVAARKKKKNVGTSVYEEPDWSKTCKDDNSPEENSHDEFMDNDDGSMRKDAVELYCVVCSKKFKSEKQWKNHEQSKKHKEKVAELKNLLQEEERFFATSDDEDFVIVDCDYKPSEEANADYIEELRDGVGDQSISEKDKDEDETPEEKVEEYVNSANESSFLETISSEKEIRQEISGMSFENLSLNNGAMLDHEERSSIEIDSGTRETGNEQKDFSKARKKMQNNKGGKKNHHANGGENYAQPSEENGVSCHGQDAKASEEDSSGLYEQDVLTRSKGGWVKEKKQGHKKGSLGEKELSRDHELKNSSNPRKQKGSSSKALSNSCGTCGETFESRNKLFAHLGDTGHVVLKSR